MRNSPELSNTGGDWPTISLLQGKKQSRSRKAATPSTVSTSACSALPVFFDVKQNAMGVLHRIAGKSAATAEKVFAGSDVAVFKMRRDALDLALAAKSLQDPVRPSQSNGNGSGEFLCVKLSFFNKQTRAVSIQHFLSSALHEASAHVEISRRNLSQRVCGLRSFRICPRILLSGLHVGDKVGSEVDRCGCVFVTVMEFAPGETINNNINFLKRVKAHDISSSLYVQLEKAVVGLWMRGYVHGDLHYNNVIKSGRSFQIIDFGLAIPLSAALTSQITQAFSKLLAERPGGSVTRLWYDILKANVENAQINRNIDFYHSDGKFLAFVRHGVRDPQNLGLERRKAWECISAAPPSVRSTSPTAYSKLLAFVRRQSSKRGPNLASPSTRRPASPNAKKQSASSPLVIDLTGSSPMRPLSRSPAYYTPVHTKTGRAPSPPNKPYKRPQSVIDLVSRSPANNKTMRTVNSPPSALHGSSSPESATRQRRENSVSARKPPIRRKLPLTKIKLPWR